MTINDQIEHLHDAIRRYCMDRHFYWSNKYRELDSARKNLTNNGYTDEALRTFPRYNLLNAILTETERYRPDEFKTFDEAKRFFGLVASEAENIFTKPPNGSIEQGVMNEERELLHKFINEITDKDLSLIEPLFYRKVLSSNESEKVREKIYQRWEVSKSYWYPLSQKKREDIEAFQDSYFENDIGAEKLKELLHNRGVKTVWEIREDGMDYEYELSIFEPYYNGAEGFWCDDKFDWIIYASHESSITVGGWLLPEIQEYWTDWQKYIWTSPFFD